MTTRNDSHEMVELYDIAQIGLYEKDFVQPITCTFSTHLIQIIIFYTKGHIHNKRVDCFGFSQYKHYLSDCICPGNPQEQLKK